MAIECDLLNTQLKAFQSMFCTKHFFAMTTLSINAEALQTPSELRSL